MQKKLYIIGIGPGDYESLTIRAERALMEAEVIVGYTVYIELVKKFLPDKEYLTTPMTKEEVRCRMAFEQADAGKKVAMVCSGDAGVYGMAGLLYELNAQYPEVELEVIAGLTAALSGGAVLGAPLTHDFVVISLSDRLTTWETIEKRLRCAAEGDFAIAIYNPSSKSRADYLQKACDILLEYKAADTVCGIVRNIGRQGQEHRIVSLLELREIPVDMFTTVFIGTAQTKQWNDKMITPRGYHLQA